MANLDPHIESHWPHYILDVIWKRKRPCLVAIVADGAAFGKANEVCAWLVSFLKVLKRVSSPYDNFLICDGNCSEDHPSMIEYGKLLRSQISILENSVFTVRGQQAKCNFKLLSSDMKWVSTFFGELSNAATHQYTFANVTKNELKEIGHTLGTGAQG